MPKLTPLYVDIDGTLIDSDCLYESFLRLIRQNPLHLVSVCIWFYRGKRSLLKSEIAARVDIDVSLLPYNRPLIAWLEQEKQKGRKLILATASHQKYADAIAKHLGLFDQVLASSEKHNLKGKHKAQALITESGDQGFEYAGDSKADLSVWKHAKAAVVVSNDPNFIAKVKNLTSVSQTFASKNKGFEFKLLHAKRWVIGTLIFLPFFFSNAAISKAGFFNAGLSFLAACLFISAISVLYDLLNLEEHRQKKVHNNAFASGEAQLLFGGLLSAALALSGLVITAIAIF